MNTLSQFSILLESLGSVQGRKKLQKMVHILQEFGVPFGVRFGYHFFGPFSDQLRDLLVTCAYDKLIKEEKVDGPYPTSEFKPEPRMSAFLDAMKLNRNPAWIAFAKELNSKSARELEALSTLIYVENMKAAGELKEEVDDAFRELKPGLVELLPASHELLSAYREQFADLAAVA